MQQTSLQFLSFVGLTQSIHAISGFAFRYFAMGRCITFAARLFIVCFSCIINLVHFIVCCKRISWGWLTTVTTSLLESSSLRHVLSSHILFKFLKPNATQKQKTTCSFLFYFFKFLLRKS